MVRYKSVTTVTVHCIYIKQGIAPAIYGKNNPERWELNETQDTKEHSWELNKYNSINQE